MPIDWKKYMDRNILDMFARLVVIMIRKEDLPQACLQVNG